MSGDLTANDIAGVLDQLYRGAAPGGRPDFILERPTSQQYPRRNTDAGGVPCRFYLSMRAEELRKFSGRQRSLRSDFFERVGILLECEFSILMSYPRLSKDGTLAFASLRMVESWPPVSEAALERVCSHGGSGSPLQLLRSGLDRLFVDDRGSGQLQPIVLSDDQFGRLAGKHTFTEDWLHECLNGIAIRPELFPFVFFEHQIVPNRKFSVMQENYIINNWRRITQQDWKAALKRYKLEEPGDAANL